jgi:hypothetical protein
MSITITSSAPADNLTNATLASAGIDAYTINLVNQAQDTCNLVQIPDTWTGNPIITQGATVTIKEDGTVVFVGICLTDPRNAVATAHAIAYQIAGPWYWLDQIEYRQRHQRWTGSGLGWVYLPDCTLNQAENGTSLTTGAQIAAAIDYAIAQGALIAKGTIAAGIILPWESASAITCADVIRRQLAWTPDHVLWINYAPASGHPQINVTPRASMPTASVALSDYTTTKAAIRPRYDLQLPGVEIIFNITQDNNGQTYMAVQTETAGTHTDPRALRAVIELAGSTSSSAQFQEIVTSNFPTAGDPAALNWLDKAWWKLRNPALAVYANADMTLHDPVIEVEKDDEGDPLYSIGELPRILEEGTVTPWMEAGGVKSAGVSITVQLDAIERDAIGQEVRKFANRALTLKVTGTNGLTRRYSRSEFSSTSEEIPEGIAAAIYAALSPLTYEGDLTVIGEAPASGYRPGQLFNITGGRTEWATMAAVIQSVTRNAADGSCAITFGPAKHLGVDDLARLSRRIRSRKVPFSYIPRQTGIAGDGAGILGGGRGPQNQPGAEGGKPEKEVIETAYDPDYPPQYSAQIILDPEEITPSDAATRTDPVIIKPRIIQTVERQGDALVRVQRSYLVSDPVTDPVEIDPDEPGGGGPEDPTDCDQNTHPGDGDYGDPADPNDPVGGDHPGTGVGDPEPHPGTGDCYTTGDYT